MFIRIQAYFSSFMLYKGCLMIAFPNKDLFKLTAIATAITLLTACGGSDSIDKAIDDVTDKIEDTISEEITGATTLEGTFIDSAVAGINYECGDNTGVTDADGKFDYNLGDTCTFKIGDILLGTVENILIPLVTPFDIAEDEEAAIKIASLLQTIDADGDPENGIDITGFDASDLTADIFSADEDAFYAAVYELTGTEAVTLDDAAAHMALSLGILKGYHSTAIEAVITKVQGVSDFEQLDVEAFLAEISLMLAVDDGSDSNDITALQSIISIFEILNNDIVKNRIDITGNPSDYSTFLPQIIDASIHSSEVMLTTGTGSTADISNLFYDMATRLASASDALGASFEDETYVANYGEDDNGDPVISLNAETAQGIQAMALGYSSVLSYFSAYNYGSDAYYLPETIEQDLDVVEVDYSNDMTTYTGTTITAESEYTTAGIHPETQMLDSNFGSLHTDTKHLTLAKESLIKVMELARTFILNEDVEDTVEADTEKSANVAKIESALNNLKADDGTGTPIDLGLFSDEDEGKINLQAMYSVDTAIDRNDFDITASIDCGDYSYSEAFSKYMDKPMCSLGDYEDGTVVNDENSTFIDYTEPKSLHLYAFSASVDISVEPKDTADPERILLECTFTNEAGEAEDCLE